MIPLKVFRGARLVLGFAPFGEVAEWLKARPC